MISPIVPFFVVDRPISLRIINGLMVPEDKKIGLMAHASTTANFRKAFREFPTKQTIKMCDSAIFESNRGGYVELFERYHEMGADYGVMIDAISDSKGTLLSAEKAFAAYDPKTHTFKLVGVAQGKTTKEYLDCYARLLALGFEHIAVGGLLQRRERTARYLNVRDEIMMRGVLTEIRELFDPKWLFALGCFHPSRLGLFKQLNVWGDYKGWIFEYETRDESLSGTIITLRTNHLAHSSLVFRSSLLGKTLAKTLGGREKRIRERKRNHLDLLSAKRTLRDFTAQALTIVSEKSPGNAALFQPLRARALLSKHEQNLIARSLKHAGAPEEYLCRIYTLSSETRLLKDRLVKSDEALKLCNAELLLALRGASKCKQAAPELRKIATVASNVLSKTEQAHRIRQVRDYIQSAILQKL